MVRSSNGKDASLSRKKQKFNSSANHHYLCEYLLSCDLDKSHFIKFCDIFNIANLASSFNGQDISLSRQRQGFNSPRSRHSPYGLKDRTNQASEATVMLKPISLLIKVNPSLCRKTNIFVELIFRQIICQLSLQVKIVAYHREISALVGRYAGVAEQADARVLKTLGVIPYGFNSRHQHHLFIRHLQQISKYKLCIVGSSPTIFHLFGRYRLVGKAEDYFKCLEYAAVAKLANAGVSNTLDGNIFQVQVLSAAPKRFPFDTE